MRPKFPAIEMAKNVEHTPARIAQLLHGDPSKDKAARSTGPSSPSSSLIARIAYPENSRQPRRDRPGHEGGLQLGARPLRDVRRCRRPRHHGKDARRRRTPIAANVEKLLAYADKHGEANPTWYKDDASVPSGRLFFDPVAGDYKPVVTRRRSHLTRRRSRRRSGVVKKNPGASVIDLGDGVAAIELHSKMNALGDDIVRLITQTLKPASEHRQQLRGLRHHRRLGQLLRRRQPDAASPRRAGGGVGRGRDGRRRLSEHDAGDQVLSAAGRGRALWHVSRRRRRDLAPRRRAPASRRTLHGPRRGWRRPDPRRWRLQGDVVLRSIEAGSSIRPDARGEGVEIFEAIKKNFETIAKATVSTSAAEARSLGFLRDSDNITTNRDRLSPTRSFAPVPSPTLVIAAPVAAHRHSRTRRIRPGHAQAGRVDHARRPVHLRPRREGRQLGRLLLAGGKVNPGTLVSEQYLLDLEREAFVSLCGEKKTQERIAFTLKTGKPLRN